jgi:hypothetical protein
VYSAPTNPTLGRFVPVLYLAVAVVELSIIVLAAPSMAEIGSFYVTVP